MEGAGEDEQRSLDRAEEKGTFFSKKDAEVKGLKEWWGGKTEPMRRGFLLSNRLSV